jgi:hypothetical protein
MDVTSPDDDFGKALCSSRSDIVIKGELPNAIGLGHNQ